jgi:iron(III) transport system substrate-binding protein
MIAQAKEEGELVIIGSHGEAFATEQKGFLETYPFLTVKGLDQNTVKTVNRVVMESKAGRVTTDVVEVSDEGMYALAGEGVLQMPLAELPHVKDFDPKMQPSSGLFVTWTLNPRPLAIYNTELVSPEEVPKSYEEVTDPRWKGRTIVSASGEEQPAVFAWLWRKDGKLNWERSFAWWTKIFEHEPLITNGYRAGAEQVAAGHKGVFWLTPPGPSSRLFFEGAPVKLQFMNPNPAIGNRCMAVVKGSSHPAAAWLFMDYFTSPKGQSEATEVEHAALPMNPKAKPGKLARWIIEAGGTWENSEAAQPGFNLDTVAEVLYVPEVSKMSEDFFLEQMGVR